MAKSKTSKLLTGHLNKILKEKYEVPVIVKGKEVFVTKGEALARQMVSAAIGYVETMSTFDKNGEPSGTMQVVHAPDRNIAKEILDRVEGRVATTDAKEEDNRPTIADKVTEINKDKLNKMAKNSSLKI